MYEVLFAREGARGNGRLFTTILPTLSSSGSGNSLTQPSITNSFGRAIGKIVSTLAEIKNISIVSPPGFTNIQVEFTAGEISISKSSINVNPNSVSAEIRLALKKAHPKGMRLSKRASFKGIKKVKG